VLHILKSELGEGVRILIGNEQCFFQLRVLFHMRGVKGADVGVG
jgi:hypothetical protein